MQNPLSRGILILDEVESTQDIASQLIAEGRPESAVLAAFQSDGRGRMGRTWHSPKGESLSLSLILPEWADHPIPYLAGMAIAVAAASEFGLKVSWPNDLVFEGRKVGGILAEMVRTPEGQNLPVVGIGLNLTQRAFPAEIADRAISLEQATGIRLTPHEAAERLGAAIARLPLPKTFSDIAGSWADVDATPGKRFKMTGGDIVEAIKVQGDGSLLAKNGTREVTVLAGEAIFPSAS
ncbi:MAG: biotin--[acetyl-CoA-carboxylase] ligase [Armatimonadetes bacterium]|nr:biotin--[acetyl-CoA-carboxylase] ligase [Armatimonadota bacterium]